MAYRESNLHMSVGKYLCHTIQYHRVIPEFWEVEFCRHTSIDTSTVNYLFEHREAKADVDALKTKLKDQENKINK